MNLNYYKYGKNRGDILRLLAENQVINVIQDKENIYELFKK